MAACSSLASVGKLMAFGCTVACWSPGCATRRPHAPPQTLGKQQLQLVAEPRAPMTQVQALVRECVWKNSSPVKN